MSETGHARNIQHFEEMIAACIGYGAPYDPSNGDLLVVKLQNKLASSDNSMTGVSTARAAENMADTARETKFDPLGRLATRTVNYYASTGTTANRVDDATGLNRKLQGKRATPAKKDDPSTPDIDESKSSISASQQSYTQKIEHFDGMIDLYNSDGLYNPNEIDLKTAALSAYSDELKVANTNVINATNTHDNARITRNTELYDPTHGLCVTAGLVKKYVKGLFGAASPQYALISGLEFKKVK